MKPKMVILWLRCEIPPFKTFILKISTIVLICYMKEQPLGNDIADFDILDNQSMTLLRFFLKLVDVRIRGLFLSIEKVLSKDLQLFYIYSPHYLGGETIERSKRSHLSYALGNRARERQENLLFQDRCSHIPLQ